MVDEELDPDKIRQIFGTNSLKAGEEIGARFGIGARSKVYFRDHVFEGVNDNGEEVIGIVRVHFLKGEKDNQETITPQEPKVPDSTGLKIIRGERIIKPDSEGMWRYALTLTNTSSSKVTIKKFKVIPFDEFAESYSPLVYEGKEIENILQGNIMYLGQSKKITLGLPAQDIKYRLHEFIGETQNGEKVRGYSLIEFSK